MDKVPPVTVPRLTRLTVHVVTGAETLPGPIEKLWSDGKGLPLRWMYQLRPETVVL